MRWVLTFLCILFFPSHVFAGVGDSFYEDYETMVEQELPIIEERIRQINPELVDDNIDNDPYEKLFKYQAFLARRLFDEKKQEFINLFYEQAQSMGYKIIENAGSYSIDQQDSLDCYKDKIIRICEYPRDYNFSWMSVIENEAVVTIDDFKTIHTYTVMLNEASGEINFSYFETTMSHDEYMAYTNKDIYCQFIADMPKLKDYTMKCLKKNGSGKHTRDCEELRKLVYKENDDCYGEARKVPAIGINGKASFTITAGRK